MAGQTMAADFFSSNLVLFMLILCILVLGLDFGRLVVIMYMGTFRVEVPTLQGIVDFTSLRMSVA